MAVKWGVLGHNKGVSDDEKWGDFSSVPDLIDPDPVSDPNPVIFVIDLQDANKKFLCLMIEGSGSRSISLTNGSGFGRPKIMWIRNTGVFDGVKCVVHNWQG
jgi:hypothetical protein